MRIWGKLVAVFFKKCCFCDKKFKWKDKIVVNTNNRTMVHDYCLKDRYRKKPKSRSFIYRPKSQMEECEFYW